MPPDPTLRLHSDDQTTQPAPTVPPLTDAPLASPHLRADLQPLLIDIRGLAVLLARSVPALERDQAAGRLPRPLRIGRAKRWPIAEIREWVAAGCPSRREWEARRRQR